MRNLTMFITAVCVLSLIKLRWAKGAVIIYRLVGGEERRIWGYTRWNLADPPIKCYFTPEVIPPNNNF